MNNQICLESFISGPLNVVYNSYPENISEVITASWQDNLVSFDALAFTGQCHINKIFIQLQSAQGCDNVVLEVVPLQAEVFVWHGAHRLKSFYYLLDIVKVMFFCFESAVCSDLEDFRFFCFRRCVFSLLDPLKLNKTRLNKTRVVYKSSLHWCKSWFYFMSFHTVANFSTITYIFSKMNVLKKCYLS